MTQSGRSMFISDDAAIGAINPIHYWPNELLSILTH